MGRCGGSEARLMHGSTPAPASKSHSQRVAVRKSARWCAAGLLGQARATGHCCHISCLCGSCRHHYGSHLGSPQRTHAATAPCGLPQSPAHRRPARPLCCCHTPCMTLACSSALAGLRCCSDRKPTGRAGPPIKATAACTAATELLRTADTVDLRSGRSLHWHSPA